MEKQTQIGLSRIQEAITLVVTAIIRSGGETEPKQPQDQPLSKSSLQEIKNLGSDN